MQDDKKLEDYNLSSGKVIHLVKRPPPRDSAASSSQPQRNQAPDAQGDSIRTSLNNIPNGFGMFTSIQIDASNPSVF